MHLKCRLHVAQMQIHKTNIEKMTITGIKYQDAIDVMFEDYKVGEGEVTITCYGDSWVTVTFASSSKRQTMIT